MDRPTTQAAPLPSSVSLTRRAALTNLNSLIEQSTRFLTGLVITPIIIRALGVELYGAWSMIGQIQANLSTSDFRSSGTLKVMLMLEQHTPDDARKRRLVGASVIVWFLSLALLLLIGAVIVPVGADIIRIGPEHASSVRWALALALVSMAVAQLFSIPGNVLRGLNMDYTSMGLRSVVNLLASLAGLAAVMLGWSLPGLAGAGIVGAVLTGGLWLVLVRRHVPWFGAQSPTRGELRAFFRDSGWLVCVSQGQALLLMSDTVLIGINLGPAAAGSYAVMGMLLRFGMMPVINLGAGATAGIVGVCGQQDWDRVNAVVRQLSQITLVASFTVGAIVVAVNEDFLERLVGQSFVAHHSLSLWLVMLGVFQAVYRIECIVADGIRAFRERALVSLTCGSSGVLAAWWGATAIGPVGVALGMLAGSAAAIYLLAWTARKKAGLLFWSRHSGAMRVTAVGTMLLATLHFWKPDIRGWIELTAWAAAVAAVGFGLLLFFGISEIDRRLIFHKLLALRRKS